MMPGRGAGWSVLLILMVMRPPLVIRGDDRVTTVLNRTVQLPCWFPLAKGDGGLSVAWYKEQPDGRELLVHKFIRDKEDLSEQDPLYRGRTQLSEGISQGNLTLTLTEVTRADQGTYLCKGASNFKFDTKKVELYIRDPVTKPTIEVSRTADGGVLLHCVSSSPDVTYEWLAEDGKIVTKQQNYTIARPREDLTLTCVVGDGVSEDRESIAIPHNREPSRSIPAVIAAVGGGIFISLLFIFCRKTSDDREWVTEAQNPSSLHLSVGQKAQIFCRMLNAKEILHHKWKFYSSKSKKMENSERVTVTPDSLIIDPVTPADAGLYICSVKDKSGMRYRGKGTNLTVTATPSLTVTENLQEALLTCKAEKFYPKDLEIFWSIHPNVQIAEDRTDNQDGTVNEISRLKLKGGVQEEDCACHVRHCTLRATLYRPGKVGS
ncbi:CD276 antigen homolog [Hyperolius riggenbachi]|uniref:CD276 antigen homolog n=1 Tax=Hyperolius riggenbachi TaxID=752182 RepID=UPI0035A39E0F